ncbi:unnamed protein product [Adineta steineri]|uniref:Uncharacterized protein n=1 Tax=Adineta steineri TaxID=433720 RepID=A0A819D757_9BILA|nr:unnamed protein product [Adineta steineri]CAF3828748.1 unnamed protein product [Adineta steineri]
MSSISCYNITNNYDPRCLHGSNSILLLLPVLTICIVLCFLLLFIYFKQRYRNRIGLEQNSNVQENENNLESSDPPPPYSVYVESPPPPPYYSK